MRSIYSYHVNGEPKFDFSDPVKLKALTKRTDTTDPGVSHPHSPPNSSSSQINHLASATLVPVPRLPAPRLHNPLASRSVCEAASGMCLPILRGARSGALAGAGGARSARRAEGRRGGGAALWGGHLGPPGAEMCSSPPLPLPTISREIKMLPPLGLRMLKRIWKWLSLTCLGESRWGIVGIYDYNHTRAGGPWDRCANKEVFGA